MSADLKARYHKAMTPAGLLRAAARALASGEALNFTLTNRIPRRLATRLVGAISRSERPLVRGLAMAAWRLFADLDLSDAAVTEFPSLHACFTRHLKPGARPLDPDPDVLISPCDAIVGAHGTVAGSRLLQVKGRAYELADLVDDAQLAAAFRNGTYVTLRLTSAMYHRFHAPCACHVDSVRYVWGDAWNVNPAALKRVEGLFCRNERAALRLALPGRDASVLLVPVAAILVAGLRLPFLEADLRAGGTRTIPCSVSFNKGEEMGWFEHGSTIVMLAPAGVGLCEGVCEGRRMRMGEALMRAPPARSRSHGTDGGTASASRSASSCS